MTSSLPYLSADQLCRDCDPDSLDFETTADLQPLEGVLGQERALEAIRFGAAMKHNGYNIFVHGPSGTGRHTVVESLLRERAGKEPVPDDWVYLNNFRDPYCPKAMALPAGRGRALATAMDALIEDIRQAIPAAFDTDDFRNRVEAIEEAFRERQQKVLEAAQAEAEGHGLTILRTPSGFAFAPVADGEIIKPEAFNELPEERRKEIEKAIEEQQKKLQASLQQMPKWDKERRQALREIGQETIAFAIGHPIDEMKAAFGDLPAVQEHLEVIRQDLVENVHGLLGQEAAAASGAATPGEGSRHEANGFARYAVNLIVDNGDTANAPVVYEDHPTHGNLIGRVEHVSRMGALVTDFSLIKPGALHRANGGYLVLDARKLLTEPFAWEALKRVLRAREIRLETPGEGLALINTVSLTPEPIPLATKVVLIGEPRIYYLLSQADPEFETLFKIAADFDAEGKRGTIGMTAYARLLAGMIIRARLRPFDRSGVAAVIERATRLAGDSEKLSLDLQRVTDLLREADFIAREERSPAVRASHVRAAIAGQIRRADKLRERMHESIERNIVLVDTEGDAVGQVNGLSVYQLGAHAFGKPTRITARVWLGTGKVVDIEREVDLGGPLHSKGVLILSGFLGQRYGGAMPLSLGASLVFEQSYGGVDGDSASSAELYALLSALAELPIRQSLAVTGSVNQHGHVQAIGGVNEKIEGFFDICKARGLTGEQGVLIPAANVTHLMLRHDVVEAVRKDRFRIYPVASIDQGIEILTGRPAGARGPDGAYPEGSVNRLVEDRLRRFADARRHFGASAAAGTGKPGSE
ncbi:Lon protease family protein [Oceanibacterium hippocampi]|uniref:endopeptidase La n=1 Tax=Oceanibacterium hippocampi TaxID=745714 RepID=A0A1Y5RWK7_9PROT|nr:AAA family ATPase [Oceanibacterium hippocampi]SLN24266.1 Lon protease [Oceanibacterium hippocampi]